MEKVPRLLKQKDADSCYAYSLVMLIEYVLRGKVKLNPSEFYTRVEKSRRATRLRSVLGLAKTSGIKTDTGKTIKIISFKRELNIWEAIKSRPLILVIDLERGERLEDRLDHDFVMKRRLRGYHSVVALERVGANLRCVNTWGKDFGDEGYFYIPMTLQDKYSPVVMEAYSITL